MREALKLQVAVRHKVVEQRAPQHLVQRRGVRAEAVERRRWRWKVWRECVDGGRQRWSAWVGVLCRLPKMGLDCNC